MTITTPPVDGDGIPGRTRRHRPSDLYHERTNFRFIEHTRRWATISAVLMILSVVLLATRGLNLGIDFEGGTDWQVEVAGDKKADVAEVRDLLGPLGFGSAKVSVLGDGNRIRVQAEVVRDPIDQVQRALAKYMKLDQAAVQFTGQDAGGSFAVTAKEGFTPTTEAVTAALQGTGVADPKVDVNGRTVTVTVASLPASPVQQVAGELAKYAGADVNTVDITTVGPTWGSEVTRKAVIALLVFFAILAVYLALRFEGKMAVAAIVAVVHDIIFTAGFYALFQFEVTPATVTAFLTILGFSLYDTVVVFDKVREFEGSLVATGRETYGEMVDRALNAVLMRSLSTSLVALLPVISLLVVGSWILGATALDDFAIALAVGLFIGSYSSLFVAAPLLAWWKEREPRYRQLSDRRHRVTAAAASASTGVPVVPVDEPGVYDDSGVPGPAAVPRAPIQPRPRQQRRRKRR